MWQANITKKQQDQYGITDIYVDYTNPETKESHLGVVYHGDTDQATLGQQIQSQLDFYNKEDVFEGQVPTGNIDPQTLIPSPTPAAVPDPAQTAFQTAYTLLNQYNKAIAAGLITNQDPGYLAALADAQKKFNVSFINLI